MAARPAPDSQSRARSMSHQSNQFAVRAPVAADLVLARLAVTA